MLMTSPLVKVESMMVRQAFNQLLMIFMTGQYQTIISLNPAKCHVVQVYFGKKEHPAIDLHIADHHLEVVEKVKLLGVTIQCDLKWDSQVDNILKKANQKMFMLRKLKAAGLNS